MLTGKIPSLKNIRRFGCVASYLNEDSSLPKYSPRGNMGFLVGMTQTGYKIYDPKKRRVIPTKHVTFIESKVYGDFHGPVRKEDLDGFNIETGDCECE